MLARSSPLALHRQAVPKEAAAARKRRGGGVAIAAKHMRQASLDATGGGARRDSGR